MKTVYVKQDQSLQDILDSLAKTPSPSARAALYAVLPGSTMFVGTPMVPEEWLKAAGSPLGEHKLPLMAAVADNGEKALVAFCDEASVKQASPEMFAICLGARDVIRMALQQGFDAMMVRHGENWAGIPREDLQRLSNPA